MSKKPKLESCTRGRDFVEYAQFHDGKVFFFNVWSNKEIFTKRGVVYVPDTNRTLAKPVREMLVRLFTGLGLLALIVPGLAFLLNAWR